MTIELAGPDFGAMAPAVRFVRFGQPVRASMAMAIAGSATHGHSERSGGRR